MGYQHAARSEHAEPSAAHAGPSPGKRTRSESEPRHHDMTGIEAIDHEAANDNFLDAEQRQRAYTLVAHAFAALLAARHAAISNVRLFKRTEDNHFWNGLLEIMFLSLTGPLVGPIAAALARTAAGFAVPVAELGLTRAGWALAGASTSRMIGTVTIGLKGIRGQLAHSGGPPTDLAAQEQFLTVLQSASGPASLAMLERAMLLDDRDLIALYVALRDPALYDVGAMTAGVVALLDQFEANRIETIGNRMFGTREVAAVKPVRFMRRDYVVLLESYGVHGLAAGLNGATDGRTMDSLQFVRLVEPRFHAMALDQMATTRGEGSTERIDFDADRGARSVPWFRDMRRAINARAPDAPDVAAGGEDPFAMHLGGDDVSAP